MQKIVANKRQYCGTTKGTAGCLDKDKILRENGGKKILRLMYRVCPKQKLNEVTPPKQVTGQI